MELSEYVQLQKDASAWSHGKRIQDILTGKSHAWGERAAHYWMLCGQLIGEELYDDDVVADFGCGDCIPLNEFATKYVCSPMGIDLSDEKLNFCRVNFPNVKTVCCLMESVPLKDKSIDYSFCSHTLEHCFDIDKALAEIKRLTTKKVFFVVPLELKQMQKNNISHMNLNTDKNWWLKKYKKAGFRELKSWKHKGWMYTKKGKIYPGYDLFYFGKA